MAKKVELELDVKGGDKVKGLGQEIRELTKQLRQTPEGTKEWSQIYNKIDDLKDKLAASKKVSMDWIDTLENAGGPLGMLGKGLNNVKVATQSFGAALKATGIGLLVSLIGGLVAAFTQTEGSMKKLQPLMIGLEKIFGGLVEMSQPFLDTMLDLGLKVLPYVTSAFKNVYAAVFSVFQALGKLGSSVLHLLKGEFSAAWEDAKASVTDFGKNFEQNTANFEKGAAKMTKTEKENLDKQKEARQKALDEKLKQMDANDKLDEAKMEKMKQEALLLAKTEQEKLDIEKKFAQSAYEEKIKDIENRQKLYSKDSVEWKNLQADKEKAEADYLSKTIDFKSKQKDITEKANKDMMDSEIAALDLRKANGEIKEFEYQQSLYDIKKKYLTEKKDLDANEIAYAAAKQAELKRILGEENAARFSALQNQIDQLDRANQAKENDFAEDIQRLEKEKVLLQQQRDIELEAAKDDATKQLDIKKKYADALYNIDTQITNNTKAQAQQRVEIMNAYADLVGQFGAFLQQAAGKNKALAKAGLIIEQAAGVAKIIINTQVAASKAGYLTPMGIAILASGALSVASAVAATAKGIQQIDGQDAQGGEQAQAGNSAQSLGKNYGDGGMIEGPRHAQGGVMINAEGGEAVMTRGAVSMFAPLLSAMNIAGGGRPLLPNMSFARPDVPNVSTPAQTQAPLIMKTYVVENELTSSQHKQARLKDLSTL